MSKLRIFVSATIVLIFANLAEAHASPTTEAPPSQEAPNEWPATKSPDNMQITPAPRDIGKPLHIDARYYPYQQQLTFRYGLASDFPKLRFNENVTGFAYIFPKFLSPRVEAGADLHDQGAGHVHVGARYFYNERGYFRPSLKVGGDVLIVGSQGLATFAKLANYYLRTSAALEYVVWNPYSLRFENELLFGSKNTIFVVTLGISRGW